MIGCLISHDARVIPYTYVLAHFYGPSVHLHVCSARKTNTLFLQKAAEIFQVETPLEKLTSVHRYPHLVVHMHMCYPPKQLKKILRQPPLHTIKKHASVVFWGTRSRSRWYFLGTSRKGTTTNPPSLTICSKVLPQPRQFSGLELKVMFTVVLQHFGLPGLSTGSQCTIIYIWWLIQVNRWIVRPFFPPTIDIVTRCVARSCRMRWSCTTLVKKCSDWIGLLPFTIQPMGSILTVDWLVSGNRSEQY